MLTQKSLSQFNVQDEQLSRSIDNVATVLNPVLQTPILDGVLVSITLPADTSTPPGWAITATLPHGLGRQARGVLVAFFPQVAANPQQPYVFISPTDQLPNPLNNNAVVVRFNVGGGGPWVPLTASFWVF